MFAFILSNLIGLVRQILISRAFGTDQSIDAFYAASTYPDLIFSLVAGGALSSAFLPTFTGLLAREERAEAWKLAAAVTNLMLVILTILSMLSSIFSLPIVKYILAPEFSIEQQTLTASILHVLLIAPAMDGGMFQSPAVVENLRRLQERAARAGVTNLKTVLATTACASPAMD